MSNGKDICKELKAVRKRIAEENGIDLEIPECTYQGPCKGTCPRCESEVRFLENALAQKIRMGKVATVAGLALALGSSYNASAQTVDTVGSQRAVPIVERQNPVYVRLAGIVMDEKTKEPLPFVTVVFLKEGKQVAVGATDLDGKYAILVPPGEYDMEISSVGYSKFTMSHVVAPVGEKWVEMKDIELNPQYTEMMEGIIIIEGGSTPLIDPGSSGQDSEMKIDGVPLRIQY